MRCTNPKVISASFGAQWASGSSSGRWLPEAPPGVTRCWLMSRRVRGGVSTKKACLSLCVVLLDGLTDPKVISAVFTHVCDVGNESCPGLYESVRITRRAGEGRGERGRSVRDRVRRAAATRRSSGHELSTIEDTHGGRRRGPAAREESSRHGRERTVSVLCRPRGSSGHGRSVGYGRGLEEARSNPCERACSCLRSQAPVFALALFLVVGARRERAFTSLMRVYRVCGRSPGIAGGGSVVFSVGGASCVYYGGVVGIPQPEAAAQSIVPGGA